MDWQSLEDTFWNIVDEGEEELEVYYGADLDSRTVASGFKHTEELPAPAWHLNKLPRQAGPHPSLLRHMTEDVTGVNHPWLYIGMLFSSFCWHVEDHLLYSSAPLNGYTTGFTPI